MLSALIGKVTLFYVFVSLFHVWLNRRWLGSLTSLSIQSAVIARGVQPLENSPVN